VDVDVMPDGALLVSDEEDEEGEEGEEGDEYLVSYAP
jgi:glucose/arabinose dehydrogenase